MKAKGYILSVLAFGLFLSGCKNTPKTDEELENELSIEDIVDADLSGEQRSQEQLMRDTVRVDGVLYTYEIHRVSSDELPQVRGDYSHNAIFFDNTASLRVMRGETVIYSKTFTKNSFSNFIEPDMMKNSILEGLVFDHVIDGGIQFAAAVGYPQDEEMFVPLRIKVMTDGQVKIDKDPLTDTASDADLDTENKELKEKANIEDAGV
ncbi:MAG: DUF4738 domain-containing protein [Bacteroidaceae bacterium]|jgi:hypothetical protein|nr:DUF4738 domain-containing protein [Bacteroidaceae bacterium]